MTTSTAQKYIPLNIPVGVEDGKVRSVELFFPAVLSESEWGQFHRVLEAMKPALVSTAPDADNETAQTPKETRP